MAQFCVYLTIYDGDKLPPFYIGSTSSQRISDGYKGSVRSVIYRSIWEQELRTSPHLFDVLVLSEHATREEALTEEQRLHIVNNVVRSERFINTSIARGGFINRGFWTEEEKQRQRGQKHMITEDGRRRMSQASRRCHTGRKNSPATIERMRVAALNRKKAPPPGPETCAKLSTATKEAWARRKAVTV